MWVIVKNNSPKPTVSQLHWLTVNQYISDTLLTVTSARKLMVKNETLKTQFNSMPCCVKTR